LSINLDYDDALNEDASGFGIGLEELPPPENETISVIAHPPEVQAPGALPGSSELGLNDAIALAQEACKWEHTFYGWCDQYLHGAKQEALQDIPLVRYTLVRVRNYWGPAFFSTNTPTPRAHARYHAVMAAQAALSAAEKRNKLPLIQKVIYYTSVIEKEGVDI